MDLGSATAAFYKKNELYRAGTIVNDADAATRYYRRYLNFITSHLPRGSSLLEIGASTGMSAFCLSRAGYRTTAMDLCHDFFDTRLQSPSLRFVGADSVRLPFQSQSFDAVASYQTLEHIAEPAAALDEMIRIVRPDGWLFVAGPNLLGLVPSLLALLYSIPKTRPVRYWFRPQPGVPRYPFGTTYPEAASVMLRNLWLVGRKALSDEATFITREPDFTEPAFADSDSAYLLNPIDLVRYLRPRGFEVVERRGDGPFARLGPLAGGTWIAARKNRS